MCLKNIGTYELGIAEARYLFPEGPLSDALSHPALLLGSLLAAIALHLPQMVRLRYRAARGAFKFDQFALSFRLLDVMLVVLAAGLLALLLEYAGIENLGHWIESAGR